MKKDRWNEAMIEAAKISTGASERTARQDKLQPGRAASEAMAETDWRRIDRNLIAIRGEANSAGVPVALICAIISRESRGGAALDRDGWGDEGNAFGVMQVDKRYHRTPKRKADPWGQMHLEQAVGILVDYLGRISATHRDWPEWAKLKGAVVAYNSGPRNVQTIERMDAGTTFGDYGADVLCRAGWYHRKITDQVIGRGHG